MRHAARPGLFGMPPARLATWAIAVAMAGGCNGGAMTPAQYAATHPPAPEATTPAAITPEAIPPEASAAQNGTLASPSREPTAEAPTTGADERAAGPPASTAPLGEWTNVTPPGVDASFSGDHYGVQDVLVDPARPSDLYAFVCHQGVWKSTDYGRTWSKVDLGAGSRSIDAGKPWSAGIDSNKRRDRSTPARLYTLSGNASELGFWRSLDGGGSWTRSAFPSDSGLPNPQDGYSIDVDPYDGRHLLVGFHEETGLVESRDGGQSWRVVPLDGGMRAGISFYAFFVDTGDRLTTARTWLLVPQAGHGVGTWRTSDAGDNWKRVEGIEHPHGNAQIFQRGGVVFLAGEGGSGGPGVYRSTDGGVTWRHVGDSSSEAIVYGTPKNVYAQYAWACQGCTLDQGRSERSPEPGLNWSPWPLPMTNGPKRAAVTYDGAHYVIVSGNWNAGLWRYVEP